MSIFAVGGDELTEKSGSAFPEFPGEHPSKAQLEPWLDAWTEDLNTSGYGAFTRNEVPHECAKLLILRGLLAVPADPAAAAALTPALR